jgi:hypothetical protein
MLPTITAFVATHQLRDLTIGADVGIVSDANTTAIQAAELSFILGAQRATGPIGLVLVVDDLVTAAVAESGGPGRVRVSPSGKCVRLCTASW